MIKDIFYIPPTKFYNKEIVYFLDPSLKVIKREKICSTGVFYVKNCVKNDDDIYILKIAFEGDSSIFKHVAREIIIFNKCQGTKGVPKLFKTYSSKGYIGLLREYIDGEKKYFLNDNKKTKLEKVVREFHKLGFVRLDLRPDNIIWKDGIPYLIDYGHVLFKYELNDSEFHKFKYEDLKKIHNFNFPIPIKKFSDFPFS